jgi:hypothetical protein
MQNLLLPNIPLQETFFFTSKNMGVLTLECMPSKPNEGTFYSYHDGDVRKGHNQAYCFLKNCIAISVSNRVKELRVLSNECGNQKKNHTIMRIFLALIASGLPTKQPITSYYLALSTK